MARLLKEGLDYFPLDCQLNDKFELIEAEYGIIGFGVVVKLFQKIYGQNGYYIEWTDEVALLFAKRIGLGGGVVSEIVNTSIRRGIFDKELFKRCGILTSKGIQKRYLEAARRRKSVKIKSEYLLLDCVKNEINVDNNTINADNNSINDNINSQSKGKESKLKESKVDGGRGKNSLSPEEKEALIQTYGIDIVHEYINRTMQYHCCTYDMIKKWIEEDNRQKVRGNSINKPISISRSYTAEEMADLERKLLKN